MTDLTLHFMTNPKAFLDSTPLIVAISPDYNIQGPGFFKVVTSDEYLPSQGGNAIPCELRVTDKSYLRAFWCPYKEDTATSLTLARESDGPNFMFTPNMTGCSFAHNGSGQSTQIVCHSNAASMGLHFSRQVNDSVGSRNQKSYQAVMAKAAVLKQGGKHMKVVKSDRDTNTTVVGVWNAQQNKWCFYKQVISATGPTLTILSLIGGAQEF
jgi:hypothetical protein